MCISFVGTSYHFLQANCVVTDSFHLFLWSFRSSGFTVDAIVSWYLKRMVSAYRVSISLNETSVQTGETKSSSSKAIHTKGFIGV